MQWSCLSIQARNGNVCACLRVTAWRDSQSNAPDRRTLQLECRLRCYHTKSNVILKQIFNKDTAEKFQLGKGQNRGEEERSEKSFLNRGDKDGRRQKGQTRWSKGPC